MKSKKYGIRCISMLLVLILTTVLMGGCSNSQDVSGTETGETTHASNTDGSQNRGRFLESEITLPESVKFIVGMDKLEDGSIQVVAWGGTDYVILSSRDGGESWNSVPFEAGWSMETSRAAIAPDGTVFMTGSYVAPDGTQGSNILIAPDGSIESVNLILPEYESSIPDFGNIIRLSVYDSQGNLFVKDMNETILKVDFATGECKPYFDTQGVRISYFAIAGETLLAVTADGIKRYHTLDGTSLEADPVLDEIIKNDKSAASQDSDAFPVLYAEGIEAGSIVYADHKGVFYHSEGGSVSEQLINGELNSLGDTSLSLYSIIMVDQENFLMQVTDADGTFKILKYSYDKNVSAVPETELVVYALTDSTALRQTISIYQKEHQDVYVRFETGMSIENGITAEDAIQTLNTDILGGNGPDVLILDGLPVESYIEKGILADISDVVEEVDAADGFFANVKEVYDSEGTVLQMPARFYTMIAEGDEAAVNAAGSLKSFADYAEQLKAENGGKNVFGNTRAKDLLEELYYADSTNWLLNDGTVAEEELKEWMTQVKRFYDMAEGSDEEYSDDYRAFLDANIVGSIGGSAINVLMENGLLSFGSLTSLNDLSFLLGMEEQTGKDYAHFNGAQSKSFIPYLLAGVNSSGQTEEAKGFLKTLFGKESGSMDGNGFPVNRAAYNAMSEEKIASDNSSSISSSSLEDGKHVTVEYKNLTDEDISHLTELLESLDRPVVVNRVIKDLILEQGVKYLKGEQDLEGTISAILQKVNLYLAE